MFGQGLQAMIHPLFPGMADPDEEIIWGPLGWADKLGGHNSDQPQQNRGGVRLEVRPPRGGGRSVEQTTQDCNDILEELAEHLGREGCPLKFKRVPISFYKEFVKAELKGAIDGKTFSGMRDIGPTEEQREAFNVKVTQWAAFVANMGLISGQFRRLIQNGSSCQNLPAPQRVRNPPSTPKTPKTRAKISSSPAPTGPNPHKQKKGMQTLHKVGHPSSPPSTRSHYGCSTQWP